ncbi:hypothetical protein V8E55_006331, partial [Tylopilus felleus]
MVTSSAVTDLWRRRATPRRTPLWRRPFSLTYRMAQPNTFENPRRRSGDAPQLQGRVLAVVSPVLERRHAITTSPGSVRHVSQLCRIPGRFTARQSLPLQPPARSRLGPDTRDDEDTTREITSDGILERPHYRRVQTILVPSLAHQVTLTTHASAPNTFGPHVHDATERARMSESDMASWWRKAPTPHRTAARRTCLRGTWIGPNTTIRGYSPGSPPIRCSVSLRCIVSIRPRRRGWGGQGVEARQRQMSLSWARGLDQEQGSDKDERERERERERKVGRRVARVQGRPRGTQVSCR